MSATILSGTGNVSWTNNTGENVRVVINYFGANDAGSATNGLGISMNAGGAIFLASAAKVFGKNLATSGGRTGSETSQVFVSENMITSSSTGIIAFAPQALPTEVYLSDTRTLTITLTGGTASYNILIIPEGG